MPARELCGRYLDALNAGNLEQVLGLFVEDGQVVSPLYGVMPAQRFFRELFADTNRSQTRLLNVFEGGASGRTLALHFHYTWTLSSGRQVEFECVDVFELDQAGERFAKLTIIYDTAPLREDFRAAHEGRGQAQA